MIWNAGSFNIMYQKKHIKDDYITKMNCMTNMKTILIMKKFKRK